MPSTAQPGNRLRLEEALPPDALRGLRAVCALLDIPPDRWQYVAWLARPFQAAAVAALAREYEAEGISWTPAIMHAAVHLGVNESTAKSWLDRSRQVA